MEQVLHREMAVVLTLPIWCKRLTTGILGYLLFSVFNLCSLDPYLDLNVISQFFFPFLPFFLFVFLSIFISVQKDVFLHTAWGQDWWAERAAMNFYKRLFSMHISPSILQLLGPCNKFLIFHSVTYSFNQYLLRAKYVPYTVLGADNSTVNRRNP